MKIIHFSMLPYDILIDLPYEEICAGLPRYFLNKKIYGTLKHPLISLNDMMPARLCYDYDKDIKILNVENKRPQRSVYLYDVYNKLLNIWIDHQPYAIFVARCLDRIEQIYSDRCIHVNFLYRNMKIIHDHNIPDFERVFRMWYYCPDMNRKKEIGLELARLYPKLLLTHARLKSYEMTKNIIQQDGDFEYLN